MAQTVVGLFDNASEAQEAVSKLLEKGFTRQNIDVSNGSSTGTSSTGNMDSNSSYDSSSSYDDNDKPGTAVGRFFRSLFGSDNDDADTYSRVAQRAGSIVTVHAQSGDEAERAADILDDCGAVDVNERASQFGNTGNMSNTRKTSDTMDSTSDNSATSIPIIEEELQVGKREVETGGVRLRSRIVERPVEENLRLREERVNVERTPVDRKATDSDFETFKEGQIEMTERAEVPVVSKEARVVEEVKLNKEVENKNQTVQETVRKTEVDVENMESKDVRTKNSDNYNN